MYIKEERVINEPVEIIGETNYDNSHKFILHSPIFNDYDYVNKLRRIIPEYRIETSGNYDEIVVYADKDELKYIQRAVNKFNSRYCQYGMYNQEVNEAVEIEVENPGVLEVPEGKNVEDLPIKHFVALANKKGLSTVTKALNNLQVWNKNKNKSLSKWAGDMIDKVTKRVENQKKESLNYMKENVYDSIVNLPEKEFIDQLAFQIAACYDPTAQRIIVHKLEKGRKNAIDGLEFLLPSYEIRDIMDTIHQRSETISTTNDPYEFENYFYDKVMDKALDYVIDDEKVSRRYHITEEIEDFDQYVGCEATFDGDIDDIKFYFTNKEFKEIKDYIGSDCDIVDLGGPNDCCGVIRFSDGAEFTVPFDFLEVYEEMDEKVNRQYHITTESSNKNKNLQDKSLINEFSSNFDGTEFGEVEFYSNDLYKWKDEDSIISAIEAHSPIDINVYGVEFEPSHNLVITYEVRTEDYDEDRIEAIIIDSLERLEDRIRDAKPKYGESLSVKDVRALVNDNTAMNILSDIERIERNRFSSTKYEFQHNRKQVKNKVKEINDIISNKISDIEDADNEYVSAFESCGRNVYEDVNNLSNSELITEIKDMISKIKFIKIPLSKEDIWGNGQTDKESREILNHAVYEAVGGIYYDTPYPITIENAKFTYSLGTRGKVVLLNVENGAIWTCTKGGNVDMFSGYTKTEKLRRIYNSLQTVLDK